jgi:hypothetical protein
VLHKFSFLILAISAGAMGAVVIKNGDSYLMGVGQKRIVCIAGSCKDIPLAFNQQFAELFQWLNSSSKVNSRDISAVIHEVAEAKRIVDIQFSEKNRRSLTVVFISSDSLFRPTIRVYRVAQEANHAVKIEKNYEFLAICDSCTVVQSHVWRKMLESVKDSVKPAHSIHPQ